MPTDTSPSWIDLDGAVNARIVVPGALVRSDNLQSLTPDDIAQLVDEHGITTIVDLRTGPELRLEGPGPLVGDERVRIEHHSLYPESGGMTDLDASTVIFDIGDYVGEDSDPMIRAYMGYLARRPDSVVAAVREIATSDGAVLVHCAAGKDRTGTVVAIALSAVGVEDELIVADYLATGERIDQIMARLMSSETYRRDLEQHADPRTHAPRVEVMERVLELIGEVHGGAVAYLKEHGFTDAELEQLRARLA